MKQTLYLLVMVTLFGCGDKYKPGTFGHDLKILEAIEGLEVLKNGNAMLAVSGEYQGRVFVSTSKGMSGRSYGWFDRDAVKAGGSHETMAMLGGEGRMWFGPEAGAYSIFFEPGAAQTPENVKISPDLNTNQFKVLEKTAGSITSAGDMKIRNTSGYIFDLYAERKIALLSEKEIIKSLGISIPGDVANVAFSTESVIKNTGNQQWIQKNGLLAIWDLGCMLPSPEARVIIPMKENTDSITGYFTPTEERLVIQNKVAFYKSDARYLNKIGVPPAYCKDIFGSYSPELNLLNIVKYNFENDTLYVNSLWGNTDPYNGDVINIFNGEVNDTLGYQWPFFEFETSSSAKELKPGEQLFHKQSIYHFEGDKKQLNEIAKKVLGVSLEDIPDF